MAEQRRLARVVPLESAATETILDVVKLRGWEGYHTADSRRSRAGFPDWTFWRDRVVFAEFKREGERPRESQRDVLDGLVHAGAECYVWTLADLDEIAVVLGRWVYDPVTQRLGLPLSLTTADASDDLREWWQPRTLWVPERGGLRR